MTAGNPHSILIVDDNQDDIILTKHAILESRPDCIVEVALDGLQATERLRKTPPPGLIFLDLKMPGMGGIEVLQFVRAQERTRYLPVVMLTSSTIEDDMRSSYGAGANGFLHKMLDLSEFTECLKATLHYWFDFNWSPA